MVAVGNSQPVEVMNSTGPLCPVSTVSGIYMTDELSFGHVFTWPLKSFEGRLFEGYGLARFSKNGSTVLEPNACSFASASDDYRTVCYIMDGNLIRRNIKEDGDPERVYSGCRRFKMSSNGSRIWLLTDSDTLICMKGTSVNPIMPEVNIYVISPNGNDALFITQGRVCRNSGGNENSSFSYDENVLDLAADNHGLYAKTLSGWVKLSTGGTRIDFGK